MGKKPGRTNNQEQMWRENEWPIVQCLSRHNDHEISVTYIHKKIGVNRKHVYSHLYELQASGVVEKFHRRWRLRLRVKASIQAFLKGWFAAEKYFGIKPSDPMKLFSCCDIMDCVILRDDLFNCYGLSARPSLRLNQYDSTRIGITHARANEYFTQKGNLSSDPS